MIGRAPGARRGGCLMCLVALLVTASLAPARAASVAHFWSHAYGSNAGQEIVIAVAFDNNGNVVMTGVFSGTANFGGADLTSAGLEDIFLAKYDAQGNHLWSKRFGGAGYDQPRGLAVTTTGVICITGNFTGTINFGGSNLTSVGAEDVFLARFGANGNHVVSLNYGGTASDMATGIAVDANDRIAITGYFRGSGYFGSGLPLFTSVDGEDIFLVKYDSNFFALWGASFGGVGNDRGRGVAMDPAGNVRLTGYFQDTVNFGGGNLVTTGDHDVFVAAFSNTGAHQWSRHSGGVNYDEGAAIACDAAGNSVVTGSFNDAVDFGGGALANAGGEDIFLARYDAAGAHVWSRSFGGASYDYSTSLALDPADNVLVTGYFVGTANMGGAPLVSAGSIDVFAARYGADGSHIWSQRFGGTSYEYAFGAAADASGGAAIAGVFFGTASFGGPTFVSAGGSGDAFLARFGAGTAEPQVVAVTDVGNDQGRKVKISFHGSGYDDVASPTPIRQYEAYLRNDPLPPDAAAATGASLSRRELLAAGWEFVAAVPAAGAGEYLLGAPTDTDSTIVFGQHYSTYFIRAASDDPVVFFDSSPDSGYSLDNLSPPVPASFQYHASLLTWLASAAADFDYFSVYGSPAPVFGASAVLIDYTTGTSMNVSTSSYDYYYVTATDFSGNESQAARITTSSGVGDTPLPHELAVSAYPNPFNPRTTVRYDVPSAGRVRVVVYDAGGARVATLVDAATPAGAHSAVWEGRDDRGVPVGSGIYFVRVEANGNVKTRKIALVK